MEIQSLKAYQLKDVISQFLEKNPQKLAYRGKAKKDLIQILKNFNINPRMYQIIQSNPYKPLPRDILKKYGKTAYKGDEQDEYLNELNKNERYKNPLQALNKYVNKEGNEEYINILNHQKKFITQFCYSNLRGSIAFHGVGSGKTLTAVVASYLYLKIYPNNKVIVISPSSLLFNFINGMQQYGLDISDNRYSFLTYDKYVRKPIVAKNALLIVDEAHNFRTAMKINDVRDPETNAVIGQTAEQNKKGYAVLKYGAMYAHKVILLTGTAFVNSLYDIENLLAMVDERMPINLDTFSTSIMNNPDNIVDYFSYKISYYPSQKNEFFPEMIEKNIVLYMTPEQYSQYLEIKMEGIPNRIEKETEGNPNAFFSAERYASNKIKDNPKIKFIVDEVRKKKNDKFIIYSSLYDAGVQILMKKLNKLNIKWKAITGRESTLEKESSKLYYNYYNFNNDNFFDMKTVPANYQKYINNEYRVLLISRAGAEGVDTTNTQNIILLDSQWNDALTEQIIARAVRFKSHFQLAPEQRFVNVYRLFLCSENEKELVDRIMQPDFNDWGALRGEMRDAVKEQLKIKQIDNNEYIPLLKELKELKNSKGDLFIKDKTEIITDDVGNKFKIYGFDEYKKLDNDEDRKKWRRDLYNLWHTAYGPKDKNIMPTVDLLKQLRNRNDEPYIPAKTIEEKIQKTKGLLSWNIKRTEGWDYYDKLHKDDKKDWIIKKYSEWYTSYKPSEIERKVISGHTVDINMYILAKSKTKAIDDFIKYFGSSIKLFETYQSQLLKYIVDEEKKLKRQLTDEEQANIYIKVLRTHPIEKLPTFDYLNIKERRDKAPEDANKQRNDDFQQFYTNYSLAKYIIDKTNLDSVKDKVEILEPTAGEGYLIKPIFDMKIDYNLDMVELDKKNRDKLEEISKSSMGNIKLLNNPNFLLFTPSKRYDYIFMNPPFHIKKSTNAIIKADIWDFEFVKRAFSMLKDGGQLVAITSKHFLLSSDEKSKKFRDWLTNDNILNVKIDERPDEQFENENRKIKISVAIIHIIKKSSIMDNDILNEKFYNIEALNEAGNDIVDNIITLDKDNVKDLNKINDAINKITVEAEEIVPSVEEAIQKKEEYYMPKNIKFKTKKKVPLGLLEEPYKELNNEYYKLKKELDDSEDAVEKAVKKFHEEGGNTRDIKKLKDKLQENKLKLYDQIEKFNIREKRKDLIERIKQLDIKNVDEYRKYENNNALPALNALTTIYDENLSNILEEAGTIAKKMRRF